MESLSNLQKAAGSYFKSIDTGYLGKKYVEIISSRYVSLLAETARKYKPAPSTVSTIVGVAAFVSSISALIYLSISEDFRTWQDHSDFRKERETHFKILEDDLFPRFKFR